MKDSIDFTVVSEHGPQDYKATLDLPASELDRVEVEALGPVSVTAHVEKGGSAGEYVADGTVAFTADLRCSRCVDPFPFANTSPFHVRFQPRPEASGTAEEEIEVQGEDLDVEFYNEPVIPLRDLALEQIQLSIPMKPLCEESCLGLCPVCGTNRNREGCACESKPTDERWGALAGIREQLAKKKDS